MASRTSLICLSISTLVFIFQRPCTYFFTTYNFSFFCCKMEVLIIRIPISYKKKKSILRTLRGEGNGTHSSTLAWKILQTEEPGRLQSVGSTRSQTRLSDFSFTFHFHALEKEMATHSSVLAWRIPGKGEPGGLPSMGSHRVEHD